jgi:predicted sulfurtransferase
VGALLGWQARHVEAEEYHQLMANPDAVIIDVRNCYESAIGHFQPPAVRDAGSTLVVGHASIGRASVVA